ncbi:hypothetical protein D3C76_1027560 [compost metagenome]
MLRAVRQCIETLLQRSKLAPLLTRYRAPLPGQFVEQDQFFGEQLLYFPGELTFPAFEQQFALVAQGGESCRQQHQLVAKQLHQVVGAAQARRIVIEVPAHTLQRADLPQQLHLPTVEVFLAFLGTNNGAGMGCQQLDHLVDPVEILLGHGFRARGQQAHDADAGHCQQRLGHAGHGQQEGPVLIGNRQQPHDHRRVAAEDKRLGTGIAQQGATGGAQRQPQRQGHDERQRRLGE